MPGLSETTARVLIAEIGMDMTRFPTVGHLISWAGLCPRLDESAGKRRSTRTRQSAAWLKPTLVNAAWAATPRLSFVCAMNQPLCSRRGRVCRRRISYGSIDTPEAAPNDSKVAQ
jgi:hypothetical protein